MARIKMKETVFDFTPIGNQAAIKPHEQKESRGGIFIPDLSPTGEDGIDVKETMRQIDESPTATVLAVGPDVKQLKVGDVIMCPSGAPVMKMKRGRAEFLIINENEVAGVIKEYIKE